MADGKLINLKENLRKEVAKHGIDADRLIFAEKVPKPEHLSRAIPGRSRVGYIRVNGAASTSDALWAGVPVLTIQGKHFASRMSSSILQTMGLDRLNTNNLRDYEELAVELATDELLFSKLKIMLVNNIDTSHLFKTERYVFSLELAYEYMLRNYLNGEKKRQ